MKVVLCYPPVLPGNKPKYGLQPLGILYLAAELKRHNIEFEIIDAEIDGLTIPETIDRISTAKPDLVGFSIMTTQLKTAIQAASMLKKANPKLPIMVGGAHINATHEDTLSFAGCFDIAVYGEGEETIVELIGEMEKGSLPECLEGIPGVIYRSTDGRVVKNAPRPWIKDLDSLPHIDYALLDIKKYQIPTMVGNYVISMVITRGCPFQCIFCNEPITMGKRLRWRSMERTISDIRYNYEKHGVRNFVFKDSTFTANREWVLKFCEAILKSGMKISWRCNARVDTVDDALLGLMKRAGCYVINLGVESGHPQILKNIKKGVTLEQLDYAHKLTRKHGIRTYSTFLVGSPGETEETFKTTIDFAKKIRPSLANFFVAVAYPGTAMYDQAVNEGLIEPRWWARESVDSGSDSAFERRWGWIADGTIRIPGFDSEAWQKRAVRSFYLSPRFIWDTALFTLKNPYFVKHLFNLGIELIPFHRIKLPRVKKAISTDR